MRAGRRFLYWGVFFVALGGTAAASQLGLLSEGSLVGLVRWWPVALIALGVAIVVRRTRSSTAAWLVAAVVPGLMLGGSFAAGPRISMDCTRPDRPVLESRTGELEDGAAIDVTAACGSIDVGTADGGGWRVETGDAGRSTATISGSASALSIDAGTTGAWDGSPSRVSWRVTLPTTSVDRLRLSVSAGDATVDLGGATVAEVAISGGATQIHADLSRASIGDLSAQVGLGGLWLRLPRANLTGTLTVTIGEARICVPADVGLRVTRASDLGSVTYEGFEQRASVWRSPGYDQAPFHIDLTVDPRLGGFEFNPIGGC